MVLATGALALLTAACADEDLVGRASAPADITLPGVAAGAPTPTSGRVSVAASKGSPASEQLPVFYRYQAREGDTIASVAARFGIAREYVVWNNEGTLRAGALVAGALIEIPSIDGIIHHVRPGETLAEIAAYYSVEPRAILDFPANGLSGPTAVPLGAVILVPGGRRP